jgi:hypothetical protein
MRKGFIIIIQTKQCLVSANPQWEIFNQFLALQNGNRFFQHTFAMEYEIFFFLKVVKFGRSVKKKFVK